MKMMKMILATLALMVSTCAMAADNTVEDMMRIVQLLPGSTGKELVTSLYGQPTKVEQSKKRTWWHYNVGSTDLAVCWNNRSEVLERFSFKCETKIEGQFDNTIQSKLVSGTLAMSDALQILGKPKDMNIRANTQEIHYAFQNNVLRLFFRDRVLVDFCLISDRS
jgi:hypothetical protein